MITYAQNFEDVMLARLFAGQETGFYVDIGAAHPDQLSVTKHFYDLGWSGVNIEPIQRNWELFRLERPRDINLNVALGDRPGKAVFHEVEGYDALSTFDPELAKGIEAKGFKVHAYPVEVVTADSVFEEQGLDKRAIDFLKIDVEGYEANVLAALDLRRFRPRVIVVEAIEPGYEFPGWDKFAPRATHGKWEPAILAAGYALVHFDGISRYYLRKDEAALARRLEVPPGVFDSIVFAREPAAQAAAKAQLDSAQAALAAESAALASERVALEGTRAELGTERAARRGAESALEHERDARRVVEGALAQEQVARARVEESLAAEKVERTRVEGELGGEKAERARVEGELAGEKAERGRLEAALASERAQRAGIEAALAAERSKPLLARVRDSVRNTLLAALFRLASGKPPPPLPRISLVVPVFNGEKYVGETLDSVLRQEYPDLEVIVVDGASSDRTLEIVREREARVAGPQRIARVISEPDAGMYDAIAKGFAVATGEVFCYLNADDLLEGDALRSVGRCFAEHPEANVIYHEDVVLQDGWKFPNVRQPERLGVLDLLNGHILFQDGVFFRRSAYEAVGGMRRDLRLAGDYDLWLRLSARFHLDRRPYHMSCFRIRPGQLSTDMARYHEEMQRSRRDFLAATPWWKRLAWRIGAPLRRLGRRVERRERPDRLFYPIDFGNLPPPAALAPDAAAPNPRSPIDRAAAERLLFSCMDTRFGERELNHIYFDERNQVAITHPPVDPAKLDALYRKHYSSPPTKIGMPEGTSPYRQFSRMRSWERALFALPWEVLKPLFKHAWSDNTLAELRDSLAAAGVDPKRPLRFLDTGCFDGRLLDQVRTEQPHWKASGLEPNSNAVEAARAKGHEVWQGHADSALGLVPEGTQFDVIFMGQSIEHVDDPVGVVRCLRMLLAPGGVLVMSTPNLESRQIDWFGPTWAHWHPPYHRYIFSRRALFALARQAGLRPRHYRTYSHAYWTAISIAQNWLGLGGFASHAVDFDRSIALRAMRMELWSRIWWNRRGQGDYSYTVMAED